MSNNNWEEKAQCSVCSYITDWGFWGAFGMGICPSCGADHGTFNRNQGWVRRIGRLAKRPHPKYSIFKPLTWFGEAYWEWRDEYEQR